MAATDRFMQARFVLDQGDHHQAKEILSELLREEPERIEYWLWMSAAVDNRKEQIYCLKKVLSLDPQNLDARKGLMLFGALDPVELKPIDLKDREWVSELPDFQKTPSAKKSKQTSRFKPKRFLPVLGLLILMLGLFLSGVLTPGRRSIFAPRLTVTPFTITPSQDPAQLQELTGTPNPILLTPIGQVLSSTYTPTAVYVNTPHPGYGTYRSAMEAYQRGDFETMLTYMRQTADQLETADIVYLVGEALRELGRHQEAAQQYQRAIFLEPDFAPAYLGRALNDRALDPTAEIKDDLDEAVARDPLFGQAYLQRAEYYLDRGDFSRALADANQAVGLLPDSHLAHLYRAQALLELGELGPAFDSGKKALEIDVNHVPTYFLMGRLYVERGQPARALTYLTQYGRYVSSKPWRFYFALGKAYYLADQDLNLAEENLTRAAEMGADQADLYLTRARVYQELGNQSAAVADAYRARSLDRDSFQVNLFLGKVLFGSSQHSMAEIYLRISEDLAEQPVDFAAVYYWRAQVREALGLLEAEIADWQRLIELPAEAVPEEWLIMAVQNIQPTLSPTATVVTPTVTPTRTPTPTTAPTQTPASSASSTPSLTPSSTASPSP